MSDCDLTRVRVLVRGRVQGVFFREYARRNAERLGAVGWVRNLSDVATVEVVAEGPRSTLLKLVTQLRKGPPGADVQEVDIEWAASQTEFDTFQAR